MRKVALLLAAFAILLILASWYVMNGHAVDISDLKKISPGDSSVHVHSVLGEADKVVVDLDGDQWTYSGPIWCQVTIDYDSNGMVESVVHDH